MPSLAVVPNSETKPALAAVVSNNPLDCPVESFAASLLRRQSNRHALIQWIKTNLVESVDFGSIQTKRGLSKPSLWKAGAEKITTILSVSAQFPSYVDYEHSALSSTALERIIIRCELINAQQHIIASGIGARALKQDFGDFNKALKMASKSAFIDATLKLAGLSDIFTLDLEDMASEQTSPAPKVKSNQQRYVKKAHSEHKAPAMPTSAKAPLSLINPMQLTAVEKIIEQDHIHPEKLLSWLSKVCVAQDYQPIQKLSQLPAVLVDQVMKKLPKFANTAES